MELLIIACLILLNGILAMSELAVVSSKKIRLEAEAQQGNRLAAAALKLVDQPERFLSTIQVGITLIGILTGLFSADVLSDDLGGFFSGLGMPEFYAFYLARILVVAVVTYLTIVFGELVPKRIGMCAPEVISKLAAVPMKAFSCVAAPFVWVLSKSTVLVCNLLGVRKMTAKVTEEEIRLMVQESARDGDVQDVERKIVERVFNLGDRDLESIMTPRGDIAWLDVKMTGEEIAAVVNRLPYHKYPVADGSLDHVQGFVYIRGLLGRLHDGHFTVTRFMHEPVFFPETMKVYNALDEMKRRHLQFGFVCDEFGDVKGIVSLRDILEALVGTIQEPYEESEIVVREDGSCLVDGQCSFYDFLVHFQEDMLYSKYDYNTVSGLILENLGHIPLTGERMAWEGFVFEIVDMDGARIDKILVTRHSLSRHRNPGAEGSLEAL